jgi:hypothetical protein
MPDQWDANVYRERAAAWRERAAELDGDEKAACISIADGYEKLAGLIEFRAKAVGREKEG